MRKNVEEKTQGEGFLLDLSGKLVNAKAINALLELLETKSIKTLKISNNNLSDFTVSDSYDNPAPEGSFFPKTEANVTKSLVVKKLISALAKNMLIKELDLSENQITEESLIILLSSTAITELNLSKNSILLEKENKETFNKVLNALRSNTTLRKLNLSDNGIDLELEVKLKEAFLENNRNAAIFFGESKPRLLARLFYQKKKFEKPTDDQKTKPSRFLGCGGRR